MPSKLELVKDVLQVAIESGAERVGRATAIITAAVRDVAHEVGGWASDVFEVVEAAQAASGKRARNVDDAADESGAD
jgi:hypothetical protein